jgi:hypothetical protein
MADAPALGAGAPKGACRFDPDLAYQALPATAANERSRSNHEIAGEHQRDQRQRVAKFVRSVQGGLGGLTLRASPNLVHATEELASGGIEQLDRGAGDRPGGERTDEDLQERDSAMSGNPSEA